MPQSCNIVATWADTQHVHVWDIKQHLAALDSPGSKPAACKPLKSHKHATEGFALAWSPVAAGHLVSGDCAGNIVHWSQATAGSFAVDTSPYRGHTDSVEDLQWSPNEATVCTLSFASSYSVSSLVFVGSIIGGTSLLTSMCVGVCQ